jgi:5'-nucleotidase
MQILIIDMDEVMADPIAKMKAWYERDYGIQFTADQLIGKHLREAAVPEHAGVFHQYLNTPGFFRDLDVYPGAKEVVKKLNDHYQVYIVSAAMEFPNSLKDKFEWLEDHFAFLKWKQICFCGSKGIIHGDIMIDDHSRNFNDFIKRKILFTTHHNVLEEGYERVADWQEVAKKLL